MCIRDSGSPDAIAKHYLIIGPWDHAGTRTPNPDVGGLHFGPASMLDLNKLHTDWYGWTKMCIRDRNSRFRGKRKPTDVLSFPAEALNSNGRNGRHRPAKRASGNYLGDIAISPAAARRNARRYGRTLDEELRVLMLHGVLHLLGYDHESEAEAEVMEAKERGILAALGVPDPYAEAAQGDHG